MSPRKGRRLVAAVRAGPLPRRGRRTAPWRRHLPAPYRDGKPSSRSSQTVTSCSLPSHAAQPRSPKSWAPPPRRPLAFPFHPQSPPRPPSSLSHLAARFGGRLLPPRVGERTPFCRVPPSQGYPAASRPRVTKGLGCPLCRSGQVATPRPPRPRDPGPPPYQMVVSAANAQKPQLDSQTSRSRLRSAPAGAALYSCRQRRAARSFRRNAEKGLLFAALLPSEEEPQTQLIPPIKCSPVKTGALGPNLARSGPPSREAWRRDQRARGALRRGLARGSNWGAGEWGAGGLKTRRGVAQTSGAGRPHRPASMPPPPGPDGPRRARGPP